MIILRYGFSAVSVPIVSNVAASLAVVLNECLVTFSDPSLPLLTIVAQGFSSGVLYGGGDDSLLSSAAEVRFLLRSLRSSSVSWSSFEGELFSLNYGKHSS